MRLKPIKPSEVDYRFHSKKDIYIANMFATFLLRFPHLAESIFEEIDCDSMVCCYESGSQQWLDFLKDRNFLLRTFIMEKTNCTRRYLLRICLEHNTTVERLAEQVRYLFNITNHTTIVYQGFNEPIHFLRKACELGYLEVYKLMIEKVVDKNWTNYSACIWSNHPDGWQSQRQADTPLHCAAKMGHLEICRLIMRSLVDKNPVDRFNGGVTPLHFAAKGKPAQGDHLEVCKLIMSVVENKNPMATRNFGPYHEKTPRDVAVFWCRDDIVDLIDDALKRQGE